MKYWHPLLAMSSSYFDDAKSGLTAVCGLYNDQSEANPIVVEGFHMKEPFKRMHARYEL